METHKKLFRERKYTGQWKLNFSLHTYAAVLFIPFHFKEHFTACGIFSPPVPPVVQAGRV